MIIVTLTKAALLSFALCLSATHNEAKASNEPIQDERIQRAVSTLNTDFNGKSFLWGNPQWQLTPQNNSVQGMWLSSQTSEALINSSIYTGSNNFKAFDSGNLTLCTFRMGLTSYCLRKLRGVINDDSQWWGLAFVRAHDLNPKRNDLLNTAKSVFNTVRGYKDQTLGGGVWWDLSKTYKNAITNELYIELAMRLYGKSEDPTEKSYFLNEAKEVADWFIKTGMINGYNLVQDGLDTNTKTVGSCTQTYTYNQGVILDAFARLSVATKDKTYVRIAQKIADATITKLVLSVGNGEILTEKGEHPNTTASHSDGNAFKGIFCRYLGYFIDQLKILNLPYDTYVNFLKYNADYLWKTQNSTGFGFRWDQIDGNSNSTTTTSALDLFNAAYHVRNLP